MKKIHLSTLSVLLVLAFLCKPVFGQEEKNYNNISIGFYNLENLFDTINDVELLYNDEYTPESEKQWTSSRYHEKLTNMAYVISEMATDVNADGVCILGVCEVENRRVLEDLVREDLIKERDYQIVHYDSPDKRGIDVGLLYNPQYFEVTNSKTYKLSLPDDSSFFTRDQLVVSGLLKDEGTHIIVNHWPSRRGGPEASEYKRVAAADLCRHIVDSLMAMNKNAKIIVMGDMNDNPDNLSIEGHLRAKGNTLECKEGDLFNPMFKLYADGLGSLQYKGIWDLFDQIIISQGLMGDDKPGYKFYQAHVFNKDFLKQKEGKYEGYPDRTYGGQTYLGGYSDHFPVYISLMKGVK